ncbi:hypothetical protein [Ligilactobacillus ruminis]|uniref:CDP-Glycerol:Poly(Glycerophosphate) glycerophosphotransferase n=2 Tax=Ligilactobacillus ruminis TaxID=1623 RepID=A0A837ITI9_9LACO|nr:hypothetical protein [Ligilactobacillus ruminis]KLA46620.1 hypothetical protein LRB_1418 [Ligilactobacillus ruminis]KRM83282.1 hypothetical protein FC25_GL001889 [Ligilactobacillus ruminis DSM 20403 = NBRC 102161]SFG31066.1 hypothetical protein SAMN02910432_00811 [Ligilactobacillus ruminis DSM 20403 = NBRC 102161]
MRKKTSEKLLKCVDDILSSLKMFQNFKGSSYISAKINKLCSDNLAVLEECADGVENKEYLELLDKFKESVSKINLGDAAEISKRLKELISKSVIYKVVFMPYKASMWDSLESVWMAADKDKRCEAVVVPITYYELDSNRNPAKRVNEREEFPEYVPVVNDEEYDLENDRPDIIYIHNPYDDTNLVTRVESRYYSWNLKKYCEKLVYIPYYKWVDGVSSTSFKSAMYYADYTVQSSDDAVRRCIESFPEYAKELGLETIEIRNIMENKLINLGSPEVDKVVSLNNVKLPYEWNGKVARLRVNVLYNTTLDEIFKSKTFDKVKETLAFFKENSEKAFVIWRPHPLMRQSLVSMLPYLVDEYDEIMSEFINSSYGVLDTNASMHYSVFWSDMCYGYKTSSLTELYKYTGKIVLEDAPRLTNFVSKCSAENILNELKENNVVSEPDYSLENIVDIIASNDELKYGKHLDLENSGSKINNYILEKMCQEDEN